MRPQRRQILVVSGAVLERDVEVADFLAERKILRAVQREGEDRRIVAKDRGRAVALMDVAVDDRGARDDAIAEQDRRGDGDVVEHAVALAAIAEGVMGAAGEVGGDASLRRPALHASPRAPPRASRRPTAAIVRPSSLTTGTRSAAAHRPAACRPRPRRRKPASWTSRRSSHATGSGTCRSSAARIPSSTSRSRSSRYFAIGNRCCSGSGSTNVSE